MIVAILAVMALALILIGLSLRSAGHKTAGPGCVALGAGTAAMTALLDVVKA